MSNETLAGARGPKAALAAFLFAAAAAAAWAQTAPKATLVYADDESALTAVSASGASRELFIGDSVAAGETVRTLRTTAELKLSPNGSIVKLARDTTFKIDKLAAAAGAEENEFALLGGKLRAVAAKTAAGDKYRIRTPTAVCGVRGTDFALNVVDGVRDSVFVRSGLVEFSRALADGTFEPVLVGAGQFADAFASTFAAMAYTAEQLAAEYGDVEFSALDPAQVPGEGPAPEPEPEPEPEADVAEEPAAAPPAAVPSPVPAAAPEAASAKEPSAAAATESRLLSWLGDVLGFEIGSVVIDGKTYSKALIQPTFRLGKARVGLYLPVIYTSDLFDPGTWYKPAGNDEWSFGSEYWSSDPVRASGDLLADLALKIRFVEYGDRYVDPWYLNVGNLNSMTLGHGVLMRNYANDSDFPAVRRVGINAGADMGFWGAEGVVNDLASPQVFGARLKVLYVLGFTAIADLSPAKDLPSAMRDDVGDPVFLGTAVDLDIPIVKSDLFHLRAFADAAAVLPFTRKAIPGGPEPGLQTKAVWDESRGSGLDALRNYGVVGGFMGRALVVDWRLEYRRYRGAYRPTFFDAAYERRRGGYARDFAQLLINGGESAAAVDGIYGEAGFALLKDKLVLGAGYLLPWSASSGEDWIEVARGDFLQAKLTVKKGLVPLVDVSGSVSYERTGFVHALAKSGGGVGLFDENTVLKGEVVYPIAPTVDLAAIVSTATVRNPDGSVAYGADYRPRVEPTVSLETRIRF